MHSYIVSDPYCLLYYGLFCMSVVGPLEKIIAIATCLEGIDFPNHGPVALLQTMEQTATPLRMLLRCTSWLISGAQVTA